MTPLLSTTTDGRTHGTGSDGRPETSFIRRLLRSSAGAAGPLLFTVACAATPTPPPTATAPPVADSPPTPDLKGDNGGMAPAPGPGASTAGVPLTLDQLSSANAGQVVTVHAVVQSEAGACTQSVPPSCTGTLRLFPTRSAKAPRVELHGSYAGAQIRCSFPANGPSTCHPAIELGVAYAITGTVTVGGGGLQIEPTAIDRL